MKKFKLSRKRKKNFKKDIINRYGYDLFKSMWKNPMPEMINTCTYRKCNWEWFYHKQRVINRHKYIYLKK